MKRSRFSDEQIISILKEHQVGMEVSDAKRLEALEAESAKLKKMLAEQMLGIPGSCSFNIPMICSSVKRLRFMSGPQNEARMNFKPDQPRGATSVSPDNWTGSRNSEAIPAWWSATMGPS